MIYLKKKYTTLCCIGVSRSNHTNKNSILKSEGIMEKVSCEICVYESVDDRSLRLSIKIDGKRNLYSKVLKEVYD